jgi:pimeloyl-ACP methyl ester carboxylesterase
MNANRITLTNKHATFDAIYLKAANPTRKILFAVGSGGNPERHLPLLESLSENNFTVIAPYFERIVSPTPHAEVLLLRAESLETALDFINDSDLPIVGIGHSIGAALLLALAGGQMWTHAGDRLLIAQDASLKKLVLLTPPTDFFKPQNALEDVQTPMQIWAGSLDVIAPPQQINVLKEGLPTSTSLDFHLIEGAGHFSFMNNLPPNITDPLKNREELFARLTTEIFRFVMS